MCYECVFQVFVRFQSARSVLVCLCEGCLFQVCGCGVCVQSVCVECLLTSDTMMSICLRSFLRVFISCSGSLWMPTQQPFTKILVALEKRKHKKERNVRNVKLHEFNKL